MPNYIALAIPFFFALIAGELVLARVRGLSVYRLSDALTDVSCGVTSQMAVLLLGALQVGVYGWLYDHGRLLSISTPWVAWVAAFVGVDLAYYAWHRASHQVNVLWAAHIVHHQSEDYNLAVALRQSVLTSWTILPFYAPLALLGVPLIPFLTASALSTLYQFWIHTQLVRPMRGPLDYVFNLPAHHRVHHAINTRYLDKNFGATLIVWDRWLGTYARETDPPVYGVTKPLASFNPWWAQVHYWVELTRLMARTPRRLDKLRLWFKSPAWTPDGVPALVCAEPSPATFVKYDVTLSPRLGLYLLSQYALVVLGATALIFCAKHLSATLVTAAAVLVLLSLLSFGALLEQRRWGIPLEVGRLLAALVLGSALLA